MLTFFTDTDLDFSRKEAEENGFKLISMPYSYDGKTIYPYVDFDEFDGHAFYDMLRNGVLPTTSAIPKSNTVIILNRSLQPETIFFTFISRQQ